MNTPGRVESFIFSICHISVDEFRKVKVWWMTAGVSVRVTSLAVACNMKMWLMCFMFILHVYSLLAVVNVVMYVYANGVFLLHT